MDKIVQYYHQLKVREVKNPSRFKVHRRTHLTCSSACRLDLIVSKNEGICSLLLNLVFQPVETGICVEDSTLTESVLLC